MGSYQNPIGAPDPIGKFKVERIEEDKLTHNDRPPHLDPPPEEKFGLIAFFIQTFYQLIDFFLNTRPSSKIKKAILEDLFLLKGALEILKREDRSQDAPFLAELSQIWARIIEDSLDSDSPELKKIIKQVQSYPEHQVHTLGYYLSEYAGQKWLPFPYMELIQKMHKEHEKNPQGSTLSQWTYQIDQLQ